MGDTLPGLLWLVVLLAGNAFFVAAEFAVVSARRSQIEPRAAAGSRIATTTLWAMENATLMLATSQLGITVCSLLILIVAEPAIHHLLESPLAWVGLSADAVTVTAFAVALVLVTALHVVLGEMVPKNLSFSLPDRAALLLAPPLVAVSKVFHPVIAGLNWVANHAVRLFGVQPVDEAVSAFTREEVAGIVAQSQREGTLTDSSGALAGAFEFTDKRAGEVDVPLDRIVGLPAHATPREVQAAVAEHGFSRYVVTAADGQPLGYLHMKDVMELHGPAVDEPVPPKRWRRLPAVTPETELEDAVALLRLHGAHVARTVRPDGTTRGLLFLEDALEILVGEIDDAVS